MSQALGPCHDLVVELVFLSVFCRLPVLGVPGTGERLWLCEGSGVTTSDLQGTALTQTALAHLLQTLVCTDEPSCMLSPLALVWYICFNKSYK